jgi:hypothetical protein
LIGRERWRSSGFIGGFIAWYRRALRQGRVGR